MNLEWNSGVFNPDQNNFNEDEIDTESILSLTLDFLEPMSAFQKLVDHHFDDVYDGQKDYDEYIDSSNINQLEVELLRADVFTAINVNCGHMKISLTQKHSDNYGNQKVKFGFVQWLHKFDTKIKTYLLSDYSQLDHLNLQFYCGLFLLYFLGMRPAYNARTINNGYTGLLNLQNDNLYHLDDENSKIKLKFEDKMEKVFDKEFFIPKNIYAALQRLVKINKSMYRKQLFPHFQPDIAKPPTLLFALNLKRFFNGLVFSFRTFRVHAISTCYENLLSDTNTTDTTLSYFHKIIRIKAMEVALKLSDHDRSSIFHYIDYRIVMLKAINSNIMDEDLVSIKNTFKTQRNNTLWVRFWNKCFMARFVEFFKNDPSETDEENAKLEKRQRSLLNNFHLFI